MKSVKIKVSYFPSFQIIGKERYNLHTLAFFLITDVDVNYKISSYKEWLGLIDQDIVTGNAYQLIRYKDNIYINLGFDDFEVDVDGNALPIGSSSEFKISIEEFIKSLDEWERILSLEPQLKEIIIKQDDEGKISFETIF